MTDSKSQRGYKVTGRVQGVGFRWWTIEKGTEMGICGTVKNLRDGAVEVHASGRPDDLEELKRLLQVGPRSASVRSVEEIPSLGPLPSSFEVLF